MNDKPQFPLYIPSKGRYEQRKTADYLDYMQVPYKLVIEEQEYKKYLHYVDATKLLVLDKKFQDEYDTCDDLGSSKSKGPGAARNFAWEHSISEGFSHHWVMDDNINSFRRFNKNTRIKIKSGVCFKVMEDFVLRYKNIAMSGPNYMFFVIDQAGADYGPFTINTRIYSCNLIRNDVPYRWRGRYNEDTILSLDMLKAGWCTVQFNVFLQEKANTQTLKGGNTKEFYEKEGTLPKSKMLVAVHPDCSELKLKYGRWHHMVNYRKFKKENKLLRVDGYNHQNKENEYGIKLNKLT